MDDEQKSKLEKLRAIYREFTTNGLLIERQNNISWLFRGRSHISLAAESGVYYFLLTDDSLYLLINNIERPRVLDEEFSTLECTVIEYFWFDEGEKEKQIKRLTGGSYIKDHQIEEQIKHLRICLSEYEINSYRMLGKATARIMEETCRTIAPGMTENKIASIMAQKAIERGIEPIVLLVAADERIFNYRHPLPTELALDRYVMLVMGLRSSGLITCITRFVSFSGLKDKIKAKRDACHRISAAAISETRPGNSTARVFGTIIDEYGKNGYPDEWKLHHQGGIVGFCPREYKITGDIDLEIKLQQAFAWNPSITGFKCEDTILVLEQGNEVITHTEGLPYMNTIYNGNTIKTADIWVRD